MAPRGALTVHPGPAKSWRLRTTTVGRWEVPCGSVGSPKPHTSAGANKESGQSVGGQMEGLSFCLSSTIYTAIGCVGFHCL